MNKIIEATAAQLTKEGKYLVIPAESGLRTINPVSVVEENRLNGLDIKLANILGNEITNIKENIIPLIKTFGTEVTEAINKKNQINPLDNVNIYTAELPYVFEEMISRNMIKTDTTISRSMSPATVIIPTPSADKIREYLIYGSGQIEKLLKEFTDSVSDKELVRIWETYLNRVSNDNPNYTTLGYKVNDGIYGLDLFIMSILIKNLVNILPEGVRTGNNNYREAMNDLDVVLDLRIGMVAKLLDVQAKGSKLIYKSNGLKEVIVIKDTYDKFLENGGCPEAIYGAILSDVKTGLDQSILNKKDLYIDRWDKYVSDLTIERQLGSLNTHRIAYKLVLLGIINDHMSEDVKESIPEEIMDNLDTVINDYIHNTKNEDLFNVAFIAEDIFSNVLFRHTNTKEFLGYMKQYAIMDPNINPKVAATYASMDLVTDYLLTQIKFR